MRTAIKPAALFLFFMALAVRAYHLDIPFLEPFNNYSRQSMCASVARNFYTHGFNLFYPEVDGNGAGPNLYNVEMPIYSYLMALGYRFAGGVKEWIARLVSVAFSMGFLAFLYLFMRKAANEISARWALLFAALSPMVVALSRSIQPDITMLFAGTGALYFFYLYSESGKFKYYALSAVFLFFAVLTRIFALYFLLPIVCLAWEKEGFQFLRNLRHYAYLIFVLLSLSWYVYMWKMGRELNLLYEPYRYSPATGYFVFLDYLRLKNLVLPAKAVFLHLLTPIGAVLFCLGIPGRGRARRVFGVWFGSTVFYLLLLWRTALIHPYYFLPLAGPTAFFVARGIECIRRGEGIWGRLKHPVVVMAAATLLFLNLFYYYRLLYFVPADRMAVVEAGMAVDAMASQEALVVAAYQTSPIQLYYCHRRGWSFDLREGVENERIVKLEGLRQKGALFFITTELDALGGQPALTAYLSRFHLEKKTERYGIWRLGGQGA